MSADPTASAAGDPRRKLPAIDRLVAAVRREDPQLPAWAAQWSAREVVIEARSRLNPAAADVSAANVSLDALTAEATHRARNALRVHPTPVINATGVVLHTNLGRAPLAPGAAQAAAAAASHYGDLELDLQTGRRGDRVARVAARLRALSGAEAAHVVNNNAAALMLAVNTLANGREVVVSRGELVEIGGSFRLPEILAAAGARLVEVGTTNRTRPEDYERAIGPETALLLKVHRSNFEQRGFVREVELRELVPVARAAGLPLLEDLGSGMLVDLRSAGWPEESFAPARLGLGADAVCFSGDKLLGGPQAGILLGSAAQVGAMRRNPLARALRLDKMSLAALDWTLTALLGGDLDQLPTLRMLREPAEVVGGRALALRDRLAPRCQSLPAPVPTLRLEETQTPVGGGSLPGHELPSTAVRIHVPGCSAEALAAALRREPLPVIARVRDGDLWLDLRTVSDAELPALGAAIETVLAHECGSESR